MADKPNRAEALKMADALIEHVLASGDEEVIKELCGLDGTIDAAKLATAALRARERIADSILADWRR